jgi:3-deoxy-D-manno-octulosonic acid (KDO) 8-phosphate synthase
MRSCLSLPKRDIPLSLMPPIRFNNQVAGNLNRRPREFIPVLARSAVSLGVAAVFIETHQDPDNAPSDGPNMMKLKDMPALLETLIAFDRLSKVNPLSLAS